MLLEGESHQIRVEDDREQQVADADRRHGKDGDEVVDHPVVRDEGSDGEDDHADDADNSEGNAELEVLENLGDFDEEVGVLLFL